MLVVLVVEHPVVAVVVTKAVAHPVWHFEQVPDAVTVTVGVTGHLSFLQGTDTVISFFTIQSG